VENPSLLDHLPRDFVKIAKKYSSKGVELFHLNPRMIERQDAFIARTVHRFFQSTEAFRHVDLDTIVKATGEFRDVFLESPVDMNSGGANFPSGINLFLMTRCLSPGLIVESGVYKGQSSYILSKACPKATIHAFDPNLQDAARTRGVNYHASDWMQSDVRCGAGVKGLGFFDDHQNQARRVLQAFERRFKYMIADDSWPMETITGCGWPPIPSIDMIVNDSLEPDEVVKWAEFGRMWTYVHTPEMRDLCSRARRLIKAAYEVPSLYRETGIAPTSAYKFVELV
jgi:hypothetical protein